MKPPSSTPEDSLCVSESWTSVFMEYTSLMSVSSCLLLLTSLTQAGRLHLGQAELRPLRATRMQDLGGGIRMH